MKYNSTKCKVICYGLRISATNLGVGKNKKKADLFLLVNYGMIIRYQSEQLVKKVNIFQ